MTHPKYPTSVRVTSWLGLCTIVLSGVIALLTWLRHDDLVVAWAERNSAAGKILASKGLQALKDSPIVPDFVALAIVSVAVFAPLLGVLLMFLREGVAWSRPALTVSLVIASVLAVQGINRDLPPTFLVLSVAQLVLQVATLASIWLPANSRFLRGEDALVTPAG